MPGETAEALGCSWSVPPSGERLGQDLKAGGQNDFSLAGKESSATHPTLHSCETWGGGLETGPGWARMRNSFEKGELGAWGATSS